MEKNNTIIVGMDVHKETISVAVLAPGKDRVDAFKIQNTPKEIEKMVKKVSGLGEIQIALKKEEALHFVYEAGPCGYVIARQLKDLGYACSVIAPGLIPVRPTDRVKTDRRDAEKLARLFRADELTAIRIPEGAEEAARELVRAREDALTDQTRDRNRLTQFLLRQGRVYTDNTVLWGTKHWAWLKAQKFEFKALQQAFDAAYRAVEETSERLKDLSTQVEELAQNPAYKTPVSYLRCFKGINTLAAVTLMVEVQEFRRFHKASSFMEFTGLTSSGYSSGGKKRQGGISKSGNTHLRRILVECSWSQRYPAKPSKATKDRREECPPGGDSSGTEGGTAPEPDTGSFWGKASPRARSFARWPGNWPDSCGRWPTTFLYPLPHNPQTKGSRTHFYRSGNK